MPKKSPTRSRQGAKPAPASVPPVALALAKLVSPTMPPAPEFIRAYAQMPAMLAVCLDGDFSSLRRTSPEAFMATLVNEAIAQARGTKGVTDKLVVAVDAMERADPDCRTVFEYTVADAAFLTGLAFAAYMLIDRGGVR